MPKFRRRARLAAGRVAAERLDRVECLAAALHLPPCEVVRVGAVDLREMDEVEVCELPGVVHRSPRAADRRQVGRDDAVLDRPLERRAQERREEVVLLARRLDVPLAFARPVGVRRRVGGDAGEECGLVDAGEVEHDRRCKHLLPRRRRRRRARAVATSASPVASMTRRARIASRPALDSVTIPVIASPSSSGATKVRWSIGWIPASSTRRSATTLNPSASSSYERDWRSGTAAPVALRALLEFQGDAAGVDRLLVPVPGHPLDADGSDVSAKAAEPLDQRHLDAGPGAGEGGGEARRAGADDEQLRLVHDVDLARGLVDRPEAATACHVRARGSAPRLRAPRSPAPCRRRASGARRRSRGRRRRGRSARSARGRGSGRARPSRGRRRRRRPTRARRRLAVPVAVGSKR